jgi:hypothetical protein
LFIITDKITLLCRGVQPLLRLDFKRIVNHFRLLK